MAVHCSCSFGVPPNFQLDAICAVYETGAAAVHFLARHGAQIDQKPELIAGVELLQSHVLGLVFFFHEKAADLRPNVPTFDAVVVQHVWRAVDRDADFFQVGEDVFFRISCTSSVRLHKKQKNAIHGSSLGLDFDVFSCFCSLVDRHHF